MKDFPKYKVLKYYFSDKTTSLDYNYLRDKNKVQLGCIVLTEDDQLYFNLLNGNSPSLNSEHLSENRRLVFDTWINIKQLKYVLEIQRYEKFKIRKVINK